MNESNVPDLRVRKYKNIKNKKREKEIKKRSSAAAEVLVP